MNFITNVPFTPFCKLTNYIVGDSTISKKCVFTDCELIECTVGMNCEFVDCILSNCNIGMNCTLVNCVLIGCKIKRKNTTLRQCTIKRSKISNNNPLATWIVNDIPINRIANSIDCEIAGVTDKKMDVEELCKRMEEDCEIAGVTDKKMDVEELCKRMGELRN